MYASSQRQVNDTPNPALPVGLAPCLNSALTPALSQRERGFFYLWLAPAGGGCSGQQDAAEGGQDDLVFARLEGLGIQGDRVGGQLAHGDARGAVPEGADEPGSGPGGCGTEAHNRSGVRLTR